MTIVDRATRCFLGIRAVFQRSQLVGQEMVHQARAEQYYSDQFSLYDSLSYRRGHHLSLFDKSETYSVEGDNSDLRHYLARLRRKSRCFSRCEHALHNAVKLFVFAFNQRQLFKQRFPKYNPPLMYFATP